MSDSTAPLAPPPKRAPRVQDERAWNEFKPLIGLFVVLLATSLIFGWSSKIDDTLDIQPWMLCVDGLVVCGYLIAFWDTVQPALQVHVPSGRAILETLATLVVFFVVLESAFALLHATGIPFLSMSDDFLEHGWSRGAVYGFIAVAPPVYEEIAFRGIIQGKLQQLVGEREAWLLQAALFGVLHLSPIIFITHFGMGIALGWIRRRTTSLYPGMLIHGLWNAWVVWQELHG